MAPLVDFHDATTLLGDFTMVKSYTIDWEKTVVVYRGGHHQTVVVTNEGDALLVDSPLPTLLQHFCQDHCLSWPGTNRSSGSFMTASPIRNGCRRPTSWA